MYALRWQVGEVADLVDMPSGLDVKAFLWDVSVLIAVCFWLELDSVSSFAANFHLHPAPISDFVQIWFAAIKIRLPPMPSYAFVWTCFLVTDRIII